MAVAVYLIHLHKPAFSHPQRPPMLIVNGSEQKGDEQMPMEVSIELISQIRFLTEDVAPRDPDMAVRVFDALVGEYGEVACGIALRQVAPEVEGMLRTALV